MNPIDPASAKDPVNQDEVAKTDARTSPLESETPLSDESGENIDAEGEDAPEPTLEERLEERIAELEAELSGATDKALRAHAEAENTRARTRRDLEMARKFAVEPLAKDLMAALDHLGRARQAIPPEMLEGDETLKNLHVGVEMTEKELLKAFERHKIEQLVPTGQPFDPERHQALQNVSGSEVAPGTVIETVAPGYIMHERLLRAAMVLVAA